MRGRKLSPAHREKVVRTLLVAPFTGHVHTAETKARFRGVLLQRWADPEQAKIMEANRAAVCGIAMKGKVHSEETRRRLKEARKKQWSVSARKQHSERLRRQWEGGQRHARGESQLEGRLAVVLESLALRYKRHVRILNKSFDFVIADRHVLIEVDGCFWHECPLHGKGVRVAFAAKDRAVDERVLQDGTWRLVRFWEHEFTDMAAIELRLKNEVL